MQDVWYHKLAKDRQVHQDTILSCMEGGIGVNF